MSKRLQVLRAMRPSQWTKNLILFAAFVFAIGDAQQQVSGQGFWKVLIAAAMFCLASSGIYLINDVRDLEQDRLHPHKKFRPIAAGEISPRLALSAAGILIPVALISGYLLAPGLGYVLAGYVALQLGYSLVLKDVAMIDILVIASGFVLRALAGAVVIQVTISPWLLVCTFFLALFLAVCKRRQEYVTQAASDAQATRRSLKNYDKALLDQLIAIIAAATLVCYAIYTLAPETVEKFGTSNLSFTLPFVVFGIFRYLHLVYRQDLGERPEQILLTDLPLLADIALYGVSVMLILY